MFLFAFARPAPLDPGGGMEEARLTALVDLHATRVLRTAYLYVHDRGRAEDISQEVFLKLYRMNPPFESDEHAKAWILRVTINLCKDHLKSFWSKRIVLDDTQSRESAPDTAEIVSQRDEAQRLLEAVMALPEVFKTPILLYYYQHLSSHEIAEIMQTPEATVRSRLKRGRDKLEASLLKRSSGVD